MFLKHFLVALFTPQPKIPTINRYRTFDEADAAATKAERELALLLALQDEVAELASEIKEAREVKALVKEIKAEEKLLQLIARARKSGLL